MRRLLLLALLAAPAFAAEPSKFTLAQSGSSADPLTVLGPAAVCADQQIALWNGASNTSLQCSVLTVADTTGTLTGPSGGFSIIGGTGASDDLILDGSAGTTGNVLVSGAGLVSASGAVLSLVAFVVDGDSVRGSNNAGTFGKVADSTEKLRITWGDASSAQQIAQGSGAIDQRSTVTQQSYRIYNTADEAGHTLTNYERLTLTGVAGASVDIKAETAGSGADDLDINLTSAGNGGVAFRRKVKADIDGETTTLAQSGWVWTNTGDGDGEAITLLNDPGIGAQYCFAVDVAQTITVAPSTGESLYYGTDQCVVSLTSNAIGSTLCVTAITGGSGAKWFTISHEGSWTCND